MRSIILYKFGCYAEHNTKFMQAGRQAKHGDFQSKMAMLRILDTKVSRSLFRCSHRSIIIEKVASMQLIRHAQHQNMKTEKTDMTLYSSLQSLRCKRSMRCICFFIKKKQIANSANYAQHLIAKQYQKKHNTQDQDLKQLHCEQQALFSLYSKTSWSIIAKHFVR